MGFHRCWGCVLRADLAAVSRKHGEKRVRLRRELTLGTDGHEHGGVAHVVRQCHARGACHALLRQNLHRARAWWAEGRRRWRAAMRQRKCILRLFFYDQRIICAVMKWVDPWFDIEGVESHLTDLARALTLDSNAHGGRVELHGTLLE